MLENRPVHVFCQFFAITAGSANDTVEVSFYLAATTSQARRRQYNIRSYLKALATSPPYIGLAVKPKIIGLAYRGSRFGVSRGKSPK